MVATRAHDRRAGTARRTSRFLGILVTAVAAFPLLSTARAAGESNTSLACVEAWGESRYRVGYDHIVHLRNRCEKTVVCRVSTNVNPDPVVGTLAPGEERELLTFRGSPARDFVPKVDCRLLM
jgi:hypothetical protein